jgi:hypothetical protein
MGYINIIGEIIMTNKAWERKMPKPLEPVPMPWEQQPEETQEAFEAFQLYRNMGLERGISKVAQMLGKSDSLMYRWKYKWRWTERARLWDMDIDRELRGALIKESVESRKKMIKFGRQLTSLSMVRLNKMTETQDKDKSKPILTPEDMLKYAEMGFRLERLGLGESTDNIKIDEVKVVDINEIDAIMRNPKTRRLALELEKSLSSSDPESDVPDESGQSEMGESETSGTSE